jgi:hypothetical protein
MSRSNGILAFVVALVAALALVLLVTSDNGESPSVSLSGDVAPDSTALDRTPATDLAQDAPSRLGEHGVFRTASDGRSPEDAAFVVGGGVPGEPWLPSFVGLDVLDLSAQGVLQEYWGDSWPVAEQFLRDYMGSEGFDDFVGNWRAINGMSYGRLDGRDELVQSLPRLLLLAFDGGRAPGGLSSFVDSYASLPLPFQGHVVAHSVLRSGLEERLHNHRVKMSSAEMNAAVQSMLESDGQGVQGLLDELGEHARALDVAVRIALRVDLETIGLDAYPERGHVFLSPIIGAAPSVFDQEDVLNGRHVLFLSIGRSLPEWSREDTSRIVNHGTATYALDVRDVPNLSAARSAVDAKRGQVFEIANNLVEAKIKQLVK